MDLSVRGSRPPSARKQNRFNPITGEESLYTYDRNTSKTPVRPESRPHSRPDGVPGLNLGILADRDDEIAEAEPQSYDLQTPGSTVSWGPHTPPSSARMAAYYINTPYQSTRRSTRPEGVPPLNVAEESARCKPAPVKASPKQPSAWDKPAVPENLPTPTEQHRQQYKQYQEDLKREYHSKYGHVGQGDADLHQREIEEKVSEIKKTFGANGAGVEDDKTQELQKNWTNQPYSRMTQMRRLDLEDLEEQKRKYKLIETVMTDQLSRAVISDPEQNSAQSARPTAHQPGMRRGMVRTHHDSKVKTSGTSTENLLSKRLKFGARILTREGRDALRDLTGFFFAVDNSLTLYEFRQFGKSAKALPFIQRGIFRRPYGKGRGQLYSIWDISEGNTLNLNTKDQHSIPDTARTKQFIKFRITDVDQEEKDRILYETQLSEPPAAFQQEMHDRYDLKRIQETVQEQLKKRGVKTVTGLGQYLRSVDRSGDGQIDRYEAQKALTKYHISLSQECFDRVWQILDSTDEGVADSLEFIRGVTGEMNEFRMSFVRKAFKKLDPSKRGTITFEDIRKFYNAHKHPQVRSGECTEEELREMFLSSFEHCRKKNEIGYTEFEDYYQGLSICIHSDEDFINILKNSWSL